MSSQRDVDIHLSVVTVGEIEREIAQQKHQDPAFAQQLTVWLAGLCTKVRYVAESAHFVLWLAY